MIAPRKLPETYARFNRANHSPYGHPIWSRLPGGPSAARIKLAGAFAWQINNTNRRFEYPWAFEQIQQLGAHLVIADVGASLGGMQFTLARAGHRVHAVDPGLKANGRGWEVDAATHRKIARMLHAPVALHAAALDDAGLADNSVDVILSISTLEHLTAEDRIAFAEAGRRILRPGGNIVLTIDLFLNLEPFTSRASNDYGVNLNVAELLSRMGAEMVVGERSQLFGFPEFDPDRIQARSEDLMISEHYPVMAQCLVARMPG